MLDIKKIEEEAKKEMQKEAEAAAKKKIVSKLREIDAARKVVRNLEAELDVLKADIGEG